MSAEIESERGRVSSALWGSTFVVGLFMIIVGFFALSATVWTSLASVLFFGVLLAIRGVAEIIHAIRVRKSESPTGHFLGGILSAVVGVLMAARPIAGLGAATLLLIGYFFASGLFRMITSVVDRYSQWGWDFAYGISAVALGVILVAEWPVSALWIIGTLVGLEIIFRGAALMAGSLTLRQVIHGQRRATA